MYLFILPSLVLTLIFAYLPMFTNIIAFMDYDLFKGWMGFGSRFIGFANFSRIFSDPYFFTLLKRTLYYGFGLIVFTFPASLVLALLFNEISNNRIKTTMQTISYIPRFISWVTVGGLIYIFLSVDQSGLVNNIKQYLFGGDRILFMQQPAAFFPILTIANIWKWIGWGTILYNAAISAIDPQRYEAAKVDGANRWQLVRYVTLPGILPTTAILLIFQLGTVMGGNFEAIFNLQNPVIRHDTNTIAIYVYYKGITEGQYALSSAVALFNGFASFLLVMISNFISKRVAGVSFFGRIS